MSRLFEAIQAGFSNTRAKARVINITIMITGGLLGYQKGLWQASKDNQDFSTDYLTTYENQDDINQRIDETGKPAVIYYSRPLFQLNHVLRHSFIRNSCRHHNKANFYLVNLTKKLLYAKQQIKHQFPLEKILMEIRFPKGLCEVKNTIGESQEFQTYRRQFFNFTYEDEEGITNFLQLNGIIEPQDPLEGFFRITKRALFQKSPK